MHTFKRTQSENGSVTTTSNQEIMKRSHPHAPKPKLLLILIANHRRYFPLSLPPINLCTRCPIKGSLVSYAPFLLMNIFLGHPVCLCKSLLVDNYQQISSLMYRSLFLSSLSAYEIISRSQAIKQPLYKDP